MQSQQNNYPRPQLMRAPGTWFDLNGPWDFAADDQEQGLEANWPSGFQGEAVIRVPFSCEAPLSGIADETPHSCVWYQRMVELSAQDLAGRLLLHLEGCDHESDVWINGRHAGSHRGAYSRFTCDITPFAKEGQNRIVVRAKDSLDERQPRGKQRWKTSSYTCWYVQTTGIWKSVWLEKVPAVHLTELKLTPRLWEQEVWVQYALNRPEASCTLRFDVSFEGKPVCTRTVERAGAYGEIHLPVRCTELEEWGVRLWSPETPDLYDLAVTVTPESGEPDRVQSYFGMREIRIENDQVYLNDRPLYQRLILDQGYWPDGHLTPPDEEALVKDIRLTKALGYNGARKHQKVEDDRYYYWCDRLGLLVWCEMPSAYLFHDEAVLQTAEEWGRIVRQHYSHPCIIAWTPVNESWGVPDIKRDRSQQHLSQTLYHLTHALDDTRPVISNDGWEHTKSDFVTIHDYDSDGNSIRERYTRHGGEILGNRLSPNAYKTVFADGFRYDGEPVLISEYGGISFVADEEGWGYGDKVADEEAFLRRFADTLQGVRDIPGCQGYCYTQLTDVQQEMNGLLRADRTSKVPVEKIFRLNTQQKP